MNTLQQPVCRINTVGDELIAPQIYLRFNYWMEPTPVILVKHWIDSFCVLYWMKSSGTEWTAPVFRSFDCYTFKARV